jgi:hypothetical protein
MKTRLLVALSLIATTRLLGQGSMTNCDLHSNGPTSSETVNGNTISSGSGGITVLCKARKLTLIADSGHMGGGVVELFGRVHYLEEGRIDVRSDLLTYYENEERFWLRGRVNALLPNGSTLVGPEVTYLRVLPGRRPYEELTAIQSPTVTIVAAGDSGKHTTVNATTIYMRGDSLTYASRNVTISRTDIIAHGDSAFLDGRANNDVMRLMFTPSIEGLGTRKFKLEGTIIDAFSKAKKLDRVIARGSGHASSKDMDITADTIDLRMKNDALDHATAWSYSGQAVAKSPGQSIAADSIDVLLPGGKVRVVHAVRRAFAQADPDSSRFRTLEKDWLRGDTVTAWFDSTGVKDTSTTPPITQIFATHKADSAQAYYHLAASDTSRHTPAISYVVGGSIRLDFENRKVALVSVRDSVAGIYAEPKSDSASKAPPKSIKGAANAAKSAAKTAQPPVKKPPVTTATPPKKPPVTP